MPSISAPGLPARTWPTRPLPWLAAAVVAFGLAAAGCGDDTSTSDTSTATDVIADPGGDTSPSDTGPNPDVVSDGQGDIQIPDSADAVVPPDGADVPDPPDAGPTSAWAVMPLDDGGHLAAIAAVGPGEAYAVGGPRVLRYNGAWASFGTPEGEANLLGVWAGGGFVVVVGEGGVVARRPTGGVAWTVEDSGVTVDLHAIAGTGPDDLYAVGDAMTVVHYDGIGWTEVHSGAATDLRGVYVPPGGDASSVRAVGTRGQLVRKNGEAWTGEQIVATSVTLHGIWTNDGLELAVGTGATISIKREATAVWQGMTTNDASKRDLFAIVGVSASEAYAFGARGSVLEFDGTKWTKQSLIGPYFVAADLIAAARADGEPGEDPFFMAIGAAGGGVWPDAEGAWIDAPTSVEADLRDVDGTADAVWAVGSKGLVLTRQASGWTTVSTPLKENLNGLAVTADAVWIVGDAGTLVRHTAERPYDDLDAPVPVDLYDVLVGDDGALACGKGGTLLAIAADGSSVAPRASGTPNDIRAMVMGGDGALWLSGAFGTLLRATGDEVPSQVPVTTSGRLNAMAATADGVLVVGDGGIVMEVDADGATTLHEQPGLFLYGVSVGAAGTYAVGWNGAVLVRAGEAFDSEDSGTNAVLEGILQVGDEVLAIGRRGTLLSRTGGE